MIGRRGFLRLSAGATALALVGCETSGDAPTASGPSPSLTSGDEPAVTGGEAITSVPGAPGPMLAPPGTAGLMDEAVYQQRIDDYLAFAVGGEPTGNPTAINAFLLQAGRDADFAWPVGGVTIDSLTATFAPIDELAADRHRATLDLLWMVALATGDTPSTVTPSTRLDPAVVAAVDERLLADRYDAADPQVPGRVDQAWYWSEHDRIVHLAAEHLAGQRHTEATFAVSGLRGSEHATRAAAGITAWVAERARFGFFEWHSNVHTVANVVALATLTERSDDADVVVAAALALDLCLIDLAAHHHRGAYVAPTGRTAKRFAMSALDEPSFNTAKFVFDAATSPYQSTADPALVALCAATRYRPPQVVVEMAGDSGDPSGVTEVLVRERHGVFFDTTSSDAAPAAPYERDFDDAGNLAFWWSLGAVGMWPLAGTGIKAADGFGLWDVESFAAFTAAAGRNGRDPDRLGEWLHARAAAVNGGFLGEANTVLFRASKVALASVLDHRPGERGDEVRSWLAAVDERAIVFTTHPSTDVADTTVWAEDAAPGYWTGEASMPFSAQHHRVAVHVYDPRWDETTDPELWATYAYQPFTHAYFPQDHFDEVRQVGNWTVGARDGGFVALWSWRAPSWREYDSAVVASGGMTRPFDLVAGGGADNVWIVEVGSDDGGSFDEFVAAVTAIDPSVVRGGDGFTVSWTSPSSGLIDVVTSAVTGAAGGVFTVEGMEQQLAGHPRHESPWGGVRWGDTEYTLFGTSATWTADFAATTRTVSG